MLNVWLEMVFNNALVIVDLLVMEEHAQLQVYAVHVVQTLNVSQ